MARRDNGASIKKDEAFFEALAFGATVTKALAIAHLGRGRTYQRRKDDAAFAERWAEAEAAGVDVLVGEAWRRAVKGTNKPVFNRGVPAVDHEGQPAFVREYSDTLLMFLLKSREPEKYDDRLRTAAKMREWAGELGSGVTIVFDAADTRLVASAQTKAIAPATA